MNCHKQIILTFDDTSITHSNFVMPILKKYGFHATFFVTWFSGEPNPGDSLHMTSKEVRLLGENGFEIGNHTMTHRRLGDLTPDTILREISGVEDVFQMYGLPAPKSFAYPGGAPFAFETVIPVLKKRGYICARTNTHDFYHPQKYERYELPAFPVADKYPGIFEQVMNMKPEQDSIPILIYHGIPDGYAPCSTDPEAFIKQMQYLHEQKIQILSLADYFSGKEFSHE